MTTLTLERRLPHPVERVWRAVSDPAELGRWFVAKGSWTPALGERFSSPDAPGSGVVTALDPPHRLAWDWEDQSYSFELSADGDGCRLVFTHVFSDDGLAEQHRGGWEHYLGRLDEYLAGVHGGAHH